MDRQISSLIESNLLYLKHHPIIYKINIKRLSKLNSESRHEIYKYMIEMNRFETGCSDLIKPANCFCSGCP
ncbi:hypothetical protein TUM16655_22720 [Enterobacter cloacae]|nr:hypothetical protein EAA2563_37220 [Enterobacter asburiae]GJJ98822.1 hypothetical protein TUM16655_22720 [Enterobacter cloacae]